MKLLGDRKRKHKKSAAIADGPRALRPMLTSSHSSHLDHGGPFAALASRMTALLAQRLMLGRKD
jgi:DNA-binding XRE family transcriptional regulator